VTRYNFAFFQPNANGDIFGTDSWADPNVLFGEQNWNPSPSDELYCSWDKAGKPPTCAAHNVESGLIAQAHADGVEVYPSIGGWTLSNLFPSLAANPLSRIKFAINCVKLIESYDFDGIDIE
jgi:chitinase